MKVILATDQDGFQLKETVKHYLLHSGYEVIDLNSTQGSVDFVDSTVNAITEFRKYKQARAILFDKFDILLCLLISLKVLSAPLFPMNTLP